MEKSEDHKFSSLTTDVALRIASFLEVSDLSSLGCCSRVWWELCRSDCLWEPLFKERWPLSYESALEDPNFKASDVLEALQSSKISDSQVGVNWWKIGRLLNRFRMPDVPHSSCICQEDLATAKDEKMLGVFDQRTIHEVYNVQISFANV